MDLFWIIFHECFSGYASRYCVALSDCICPIHNIYCTGYVPSVVVIQGHFMSNTFVIIIFMKRPFVAQQSFQKNIYNFSLTTFSDKCLQYISRNAHFAVVWQVCSFHWNVGPLFDSHAVFMSLVRPTVIPNCNYRHCRFPPWWI